MIVLKKFKTKVGKKMAIFCIILFAYSNLLYTSIAISLNNTMTGICRPFPYWPKQSKLAKLIALVDFPFLLHLHRVLDL